MIMHLHSFYRSSRNGLFVFLLGTTICVIVASDAWGQGPVGTDSTTAPEFTLETIEGDTFQLSDYRGKVVVINFWATWCPPCRREIPEFVELQREHGEQGLQFVGVALQPMEEVETVQSFAEEFEINYPVGVDDGTIARKYGDVQNLPTTFVIGPQGEIRARLPGFIPKARLWPGLQKILEEAP